jgi:hypothetical protein
MIIKDLFDLALKLVNHIDYMTDNYEEYDSTLDDIPNKTLDDIIDEINRENTDTDTDTTTGIDETTNTDSDTDSTTESDTTEDTTETTVTTEESPMDPYIEKANMVISLLNAAKRNAELDDIMNRDVTDPSKNVIRTCVKVTHLLSLLYDLRYDIIDIFNGDSNINKRSKFISDSYIAISKFTALVNNIYNALESRAYLAQVNGPITSDIEHWNTEEVQSFLVSLETWIRTDDDKKLSLIDEAIQFDLKYSALLKKLVISEFKGFDEYYNELIKFLCDMHKAVNNYEPENVFVGLEDEDNIFYDPSLLAKVSAITMVTEGYIPFEPEESEDSGE